MKPCRVLSDRFVLELAYSKKEKKDKSSGSFLPLLRELHKTDWTDEGKKTWHVRQEGDKEEEEVEAR